MNFRLIAKYLGIVSFMLSISFLASLPWAFPGIGDTPDVEWTSLAGLIITMVTALLIGGLLYLWGRDAPTHLYRQESLAIVGLSWCLASLLGALPFLISGTARGVESDSEGTQVAIPMTLADALFESASGFTGCGATVISDLENPELVPRAILFWRSETHFLGGLGIMVLFVAILGQGSTGKAIMRAEVPGPHDQPSHARMQHAALAFTGVYLGLNIILTALLMLEGMTLYDALCHSFGTIATGGYSTYNTSVAHFGSVPIEMTITFFMAISCINFALLYFASLGNFRKLFTDIEVRTYLAILLGSTTLIVIFGLGHQDFATIPEAIRYSIFQVTSIQTNTGFATHDFDQWNQFGRGLLFLLMFVGGCAGSTSCAIKVIRYIILAKTLGRELERAYHPSVVRPIRLGNECLEDGIGRQVLFYFGIVAAIFVVGWLGLVIIEPDSAWTDAGFTIQEKLTDCASAVAATLNGVGPGLGVVGATKNYAHFHWASKYLLTLLMLLGRLEMIPILVLLLPGFWRQR